MGIDLTDEATTKKLDREECEALVKSWFEEFEAQDEIRRRISESYRCRKYKFIF